MRPGTFAGACLLAFAAGPASADTSNVFGITGLIPSARAAIGKTLLDWTISTNNTTAWILHRLDPAGAYFASPGDKAPAETVDALRSRSSFAMFATTCPGAKDHTAKISSVTVWQTVAEHERVPGGIGLGMQQFLQAMNEPPAVQTPGVLRAPRVAQLKGVVFEYTKGDTIESASLVNEAGLGLRLNYVIANTAVCPK